MVVSQQVMNHVGRNGIKKRTDRRKSKTSTHTPSLNVNHAPDSNPPELSTSAGSYLSNSTTPSSFSALRTPESAKEELSPDVQMHPCESKRPGSGVVDQQKESLDSSKNWVPLFGANNPVVQAVDQDSQGTQEADSESLPDLSSDSSDSLEEPGPSCILLNALHVQDVFDLPSSTGRRVYTGDPRFKPAKLPAQINLRNLNIQQIKYTTISDIILYAKDGVTDGLLQVAEMIAQAQDDLWEMRQSEYYRQLGCSGTTEGVEVPVRYGVWCIVEPFTKLEQSCPQLVNIDSKGQPTANTPSTDLFEREAKESRAMTRGSEVVEGFWVGNDWDVPGGADDGVGAQMSFDLCVRCSECCDMPSTSVMSGVYRKLADLDKRRGKADEAAAAASQLWVASPATLALRNLLSPVPSPTGTSPDTPLKRGASPLEEDGRQRRLRHDNEYVSIDCAGTGRPYRPLPSGSPNMVDRFVELIYFLRKLVEGRDKLGIKRRILVHCQDGYTESSILVLGYIMSSLSISLPEAYLHLQNTAGRSFFLYPTDKGLMHRIDIKLAYDRQIKALDLVGKNTVSQAQKKRTSASAASSTSPTSTSASASLASSSLGNFGRWKSWTTLGLSTSKSSSPPRTPSEEVPISVKGKAASGKGDETLAAAEQMIRDSQSGGTRGMKDAKIWFEDKRFDGFPSRILPFLYLGNLYVLALDFIHFFSRSLPPFLLSGYLTLASGKESPSASRSHTPFLRRP